MKRRSPAEVIFRLRQEIGNVRLWLHPPAPPAVEPRTPLAGLPDPEAVAAGLRGTAYAAEVEQLARRILAHDFPLLGTAIQTGPGIRWRRDYPRGVETGKAFFRRIPYLDAARAGDHKIIWELNRHQHLVLLAQAFRLTGQEVFLEEIWRQLESWWAQNPLQRGINWASALEVAFRALSWIWIYHLAGERMAAAFRRRFLTELYRHGRHLELNLSIYFSRNTHLLGEAVALHALGALFPGFPEAQRWKRAGARMVEEEMRFQVLEDGAHFEQSTYYHVYAVDLFTLHGALTDVPDTYSRKLSKMEEYLQALAGPDGEIPLIGDDDGGRLFHPYGRRDPVPQMAWWFTARPPVWREDAPSRVFPAVGMAVLAAGPVRVFADAGPFGAGRGGHSHSDTLSVAARAGDEDILIDPGTYTYVGDARWRDWFRGSAAHNTLRIDGRNQAPAAGPFGWRARPEVRIRQWSPGGERDFLDAECRYDGFVHRRRLLLLKARRLLLVLDEVDGPAGAHLVEQFWHTGRPAEPLAENCFRIGSRAVLAIGEGGAAAVSEGGEHGWRSRRLGQKEEAPVIQVRRETELPLRLVAAVAFEGAPAALLAVEEDGTCRWLGEVWRMEG